MQKKKKTKKNNNIDEKIPLKVELLTSENIKRNIFTELFEFEGFVQKELKKFTKDFEDSDFCLSYLYKMLDGDHIECSKCECATIWQKPKKNAKYYYCNDCKHRLHLLTYTPFKNSNLPLTKLFGIINSFSLEKSTPVHIQKEFIVHRNTASKLVKKLRILRRQFESQRSMKFSHLLPQPVLEDWHLHLFSRKEK